MSSWRFARPRPFETEESEMLRGFILSVHILLALLIVTLVLMQRGKGAEAGAGFGAGASGTVFGARGTATLFSKLTAVFAALFFRNEPVARVYGYELAERADERARARGAGRSAHTERGQTGGCPAPTSAAPAPAAPAPAAPASAAPPPQAPQAPVNK